MATFSTSSDTIAKNGRSRDSRWYVLQTKPMSEDRVCKQFVSLRGSEATEAIPNKLRAESRSALEVFLPKIKCMSAVRGDEPQFKPLFPSYIFMRWDLGDPANHHMVKYTRGVNKVLGDGAKPVPIADEVIEAIKSRVNEGGIIEQKTFKVGDQIKVKRGYLRDLIGILERPVSDSGRVAVLLNLFNRQMRVHMKCAEIARA